MPDDHGCYDKVVSQRLLELRFGTWEAVESKFLCPDCHKILFNAVPHLNDLVRQALPKTPLCSCESPLPENIRRYLFR